MSPLEITEPIVSTDWLSEHINHPDLIILDGSIKKVVSEEENTLSNQRIKNAIFFDLKKSFSDTDTDIPTMLPAPKAFEEACRTLGISTHHKIVVYDSLGIYSSPRVWWMFKAMGYHDIAVLDGGLPAWKNAGFPCEPIPDKQDAIPYGNFDANYHPELVSDAENILLGISNKNTLIIDARSHGRFIGVDPEPRENLKGGHIPNAINLPYTSVLKDGKMLPDVKLRALFEPLHIENKKLIFSCGSGITACIILLAAQRAGYSNLSVYDGSWSEWGQLVNAPVEC